MEGGNAINRTLARKEWSLDQAARRERPRLRRVRITRRPVWERMRTRKPETRLRLRLVPPRVRFVITGLWRPPDQNCQIYQSVHVDQPTADVGRQGDIPRCLRQSVELVHALALGIEQFDPEAVVALHGDR